MNLVPFYRRWLWDMGDEFDKFEPWPKLKVVDFMPAVNVYEKENKIVVEASLNNIDPEKVDVSVENNVLILQGKDEKKSEVDEKNYYYHEMRAGSFYRALTLPVKVIGEKAEASYENGILKIQIPKAEPVKKAEKVKIKIIKKKK